MKKLIKLDFNNTTRERKTEDSYSELYSYDKNNGSFEFEILNDTLTTEKVIALFKFTESNKVWKTTGTVEGNKVHVTFDTTLITQNETVICYLYFDEEQRTSDTFRFKFKVKVSEIHKMSRYEVKERFINNTVIVDRLDVVTKEELKEALKNVGGIATEGLLTEVKAEELYAKKSEAVDNTNFELVKNRLLALELKTDKDTVYDDSEVKERLTTLENKPPVDLSGYATKEELRNVSGGQPLADNLVTKEELENKHYISDISNLATKEELQEVRNSQPTVDTSNLVTRDELTAKNFLTEHQSLDNLVTKQELEEKQYLTAHQDLSEYAKKSELYNDTDIKQRLTTLESKPNIDTSNFITNEQLEAKHYLTEHQTLTHLATTSDLEALRNVAVSKSELSKKVDATEYNSFKDSVVTKTELTEKGYLTEHQNLDGYAKKSELETLNQTLSLTNGVLSISGGNSVALPASQYEIHGTGMPNGVVEAEIGTTYIDKNKTNGAFKWIKTTNGGNQGWEVLTGDTGWRTLNSTSKLTVEGRTSTIKIRRVNNLVTYNFGGLQWGWFGIVRRGGAGYVEHKSSGERGTKVLPVDGIPSGFRSEASLVGGTYDDKGRPYGVWYLGGVNDSNYIQFTFNDPIPTDRDIRDIRVSAVSYLTSEPWPTQLP
ncbi:hypothetical protein [Gemella haemolysans]|uniref:BppU N-terminal domain-containing protein n=1 Tax=Gemella haemolysans M341 TaxID=562981 RepID=A0AA87AJN2_9BACL|nr:hypothetical protein [Gemella haemolysans]EGF86002.1 hypothetical protein HMPREF0428_01804 [Gemella haemolysans M341]